MKAIVHLGIDLTGVSTKATLASALVAALRRIRVETGVVFAIIGGSPKVRPKAGSSFIRNRCPLRNPRLEGFFAGDVPGQIGQMHESVDIAR